jgi:hypothetical protein
VSQISPVKVKPNQALRDALDRLYMGGHSFLGSFVENPNETIAQLKANPAQFGRLRSYVGPIMLKRNLQDVLRVARQYLIESSSA